MLLTKKFLHIIQFDDANSVVCSYIYDLEKIVLICCNYEIDDASNDAVTTDGDKDDKNEKSAMFEKNSGFNKITITIDGEQAGTEYEIDCPTTFRIIEKNYQGSGEVLLSTKSLSRLERFILGFKDPVSSEPKVETDNFPN